MQHPDEGTIHAWLDSGLPPDEAARVEAHAATCAECSAVVAEARGLIAASSRIVSALDIVPGGVIPQRAAARPAWYARTQFRAAAAVLFVAGASLLLVQDRETKNVEELSRQVTSAPSSGTVEEKAADMADEIVAAPEASSAAAPTGAAESRETLRKSTAPVNSDFSGKEVGEQSQKLSVNDAAVTRAATMTESEELRVVNRDSTANVRTTVYLIQPGMTVLLTETVSLSTMRTISSARRRESDAAAPSVAAAPPSPVNQLEPGRRLPIASLNWTDPVTKHVFTLSGPFSKAKLEEIRKQISLRKDQVPPR